MRTHLHVLARLSFMLKDPTWRDLLRRQALRAPIFEELAVAERRLLQAG